MPFTKQHGGRLNLCPELEKRSERERGPQSSKTRESAYTTIMELGPKDHSHYGFGDLIP